MAWIGIVDPARSVVEPVAAAGAEQGYLSKIRIVTGDEPEGNGPTGTAVRTGRHIVCNDIATDPCMVPWRQKALVRGYRSSAAFPMSVDDQVIGVFTVYAAEPSRFGSLEIHAMDELATDIALTLSALRTAELKRQAEEALRHLNEELERRVAGRTAELEFANHELEAFVYSVSHDLRAPLRAMSGFAQALRQNQAEYLDADARHYIDRIDANVAQMSRLIEELLRFSRAARMEIKRQPVEPSAVAAVALDGLREEAVRSGVEVEISPMPACTADPILLQQVFTNLLSNGIKFSRGRPHARVKACAHSENGETVYDVVDNGVGFDMRYADKLFGVFQRLHSQGEFEGVGVGLALVQRIVHRHGGRIWAESELGKGAAFHFTVGGGP